MDLRLTLLRAMGFASGQEVRLGQFIKRGPPPVGSLPLAFGDYSPELVLLYSSDPS